MMLLHGGGGTRQDFHNIGYVERLQSQFQVISIDLRGHGESDQPTQRSAYTTTKMGEDLLAVADACGVEQFVIWGFSYGGNLARYLATHCPRITKLIMIGIPFGLGADEGFRQFIERFVAHWQPIVQAHDAGTLDLTTLSEDDKQDFQEINIPAALAWLGAILEWGNIEPADLGCSTLWLVGSENASAMASVAQYKARLPDSLVQAHIMPGLNHAQEVKEIDQVLPIMVAFTQGQAR